MRRRKREKECPQKWRKDEGERAPSRKDVGNEEREPDDEKGGEARRTIVPSS